MGTHIRREMNALHTWTEEFSRLSAMIIAKHMRSTELYHSHIYTFQIMQQLSGIFKEIKSAGSLDSPNYIDKVSMA